MIPINRTETYANIIIDMSEQEEAEKTRHQIHGISVEASDDGSVIDIDLSVPCGEGLGYVSIRLPRSQALELAQEIVGASEPKSDDNG